MALPHYCFVGNAAQFVANRLRQLRKQASLTQEQSAALVGVTFKYYQRLESGQVLGIRLSTIDQIAKTYGLALEAFFSNEEPQIKKLKAIPSPHRKKKAPHKS